MLGDGKGAEGVAGRKHTAHSRTALVNIQDHFLFPVTHCWGGNISAASKQWALQGYCWLSETPQMLYKEARSSNFPSVNSFLALALN